MDDERNKIIVNGVVLTTTALVSAAPVLAADESAGTSLTLDNYDTQLLKTFEDAATKIGALILGIIAAVMVLICVKQGFKAGVAFFKGASTK